MTGTVGAGGRHRLWDEIANLDEQEPGAAASTPCRENPDMFFPLAGDARGVAAAKEACGGCPVLSPCRAWALERYELGGVWGGLSEDERKAILRARREVAA